MDAEMVSCAVCGLRLGEFLAMGRQSLGRGLVRHWHGDLAGAFCPVLWGLYGLWIRTLGGRELL